MPYFANALPEVCVLGKGGLGGGGGGLFWPLGWVLGSVLAPWLHEVPLCPPDCQYRGEGLKKDGLFFGHAHGTWKFLGQGWNLNHCNN